MSYRKKTESKKLYRWLKRSIAIVMILLWFVLIVAIFRSGGTFADQAPKCIFTTMIVFGILTAVYKGIEQLERKRKSEE